MLALWRKTFSGLHVSQVRSEEQELSFSVVFHGGYG
jgi:hypothetical protein